MLDIIFIGMLKLAGIIFLGYVIVFMLLMASILIKAPEEHDVLNKKTKKLPKEE